MNNGSRMRRPIYEEKMGRICEGCGKKEEESEEGLYEFTCRVCRETYVFCNTCSSIALKTQRCIDCLNDGK